MPSLVLLSINEVSNTVATNVAKVITLKLIKKGGSMKRFAKKTGRYFSDMSISLFVTMLGVVMAVWCFFLDFYWFV